MITIDIDGIADPNIHDSFVRLLDSAGKIVAENDDGGGDPGSTSSRDFEHGRHVVEEIRKLLHAGGQLDAESAPGDGWTEAVPDGSTYELNVSVEFPPAPVAPGDAGSKTPSPVAAAATCSTAASAQTCLIGG